MSLSVFLRNTQNESTHLLCYLTGIYYFGTSITFAHIFTLPCVSANVTVHVLGNFDLKKKKQHAQSMWEDT